MGDRANVIVKQGDGRPPVVIYSHWGGSYLVDGGLEEVMENAAQRAGDPGYYTALLVTALGEYVSGISTDLDDNEYPVMVVNADTGKREADISEGEARTFLAEFGEDA